MAGCSFESFALLVLIRWERLILFEKKNIRKYFEFFYVGATITEEKEELIVRRRGIYLGFETKARPHQKSKPGVSVAPQKVSSKFIF